MPVIFTRNAGTVVELPKTVRSASIVTTVFGGLSGPVAFRTHNTIVSKIGIHQAVNSQFMYTIGESVHCYVFGDKIGQLRVHCISFGDNCANLNRHGLEFMHDWYLENRLSASDIPLTLRIGRTAFSCYLIGSDTEFSDAENKTAQLVLHLMLLPS